MRNPKRSQVVRWVHLPRTAVDEREIDSKRNDDAFIR